jgi:CRISPR-associated protein Cmr3
MMARLFIEPVSVWMFRDGRPFDAGSQHRAVSLFPPPPTVVQGALRSHHLSLMRVDLAGYAADSQAIAAIGYADESYGRFKMAGPFVAQEDKAGRLWRYFPQPADAVNVQGVYRPATPAAPPGIVTQLPATLDLLWPPPSAQPEKETGTTWWREDALRDYLTHDQVSATHPGIAREQDLAVRESRTGIDYNDETGAVWEGLLYEAEYVRPKEGVGLDVEMTDDLVAAWPASGVMTLGGDVRVASYRKVDQPPAAMPRALNGKRFKVCFATPAYFKGGWQPAGGDWTALLGAGVTCAGAAIGRPLTVGGYDLARDKHKPSRRYVPAGSVYYFEGPASLPDAITEWGAAIGFGYYLTGGWK